MDRRTVICLLVPLLALSCGGPAPEGEPVAEEAERAVDRGLLVLGHEVRSFTPCGGDTDLWVVDVSPDRELRTVYDELTVEGLLREILDKAIACDDIATKVEDGPNTLEEYDQLTSSS